MGIKGLVNFLKKSHPSIFSTVCADDLKNKRLAIDTSIYMHRFTQDMLYPTHYINRFLEFCLKMKNNGIWFIFIFDGKATIDKAATLLERRKKKIRRTELTNTRLDSLQFDETKQCSELCSFLNENDISNTIEKTTCLLHNLNIVRLRKLQTEKSLVGVNRSFFYRLESVFQKYGIPFLNADCEAEKAAAWLASNNFVDIVVSDDFDTIVCGAPKMLCNWNPDVTDANFRNHDHRDWENVRKGLASGDRAAHCDLKTKYLNSSLENARIINLESVLTETKLSYMQFATVCSFSGNDFSNPPGFTGFRRAFNYFRNKNSGSNNVQSDRDRDIVQVLQSANDSPSFSKVPCSELEYMFEKHYKMLFKTQETRNIAKKTFEAACFNFTNSKFPFFRHLLAVCLNQQINLMVSFFKKNQEASMVSPPARMVSPPARMVSPPACMISPPCETEFLCVVE
jgi:5'-3' exonuclease